VSDLLERTGKSILSRRLFRRGGSILVATSGGLDSMVLLHLLARLAHANRWRLTVAHFNHQLRGRSSDADERLVRRTAEKLGLPFISGCANVREHAARRGISLEMAARKLRHGFLARAAQKRNIRTIALAHHADDQVELFFLRLLRGAGGEGLAGMKWQSQSPANPKIILARPLLDQSRAALQFYAKSENVPFREDATNAQLDIQRNRIRHELLPLFVKKYQPALAHVILRQMNILGAEADFVTGAARAWLGQKRPPAFETLPLALQRRCLQLQLVQRGIQPSFELIEHIRATANRAVTISEALSVSRDPAGRVQLRQIGEAGFSNSQIMMHLRARAGEGVFANTRFTWEVKNAPSGTFRAPKKRVNCEFFDADKIGKDLILRHWLPGDRFQPIGMDSPVKLQNLFTNQKILRSRRYRLIVGATPSGEVFWVEGLRLAERFKLDKYTTRRLKWCWKRL